MPPCGALPRAPGRDAMMQGGARCHCHGGQARPGSRSPRRPDGPLETALLASTTSGWHACSTGPAGPGLG
jgi:hypothetical protein